MTKGMSHAFVWREWAFEGISERGDRQDNSLSILRDRSQYA